DAAVPFPVLKVTVVIVPVDADWVTVNTKFVVPALPSATLTLPIDSVGIKIGRLTCRPVPEPLATVALLGFDSLTVNGPVPACSVSAVTATVIAPVVEPARIVSVPEVAV